MKEAARILVVTASKTDQRFLEGILREPIAAGVVSLFSKSTTSGAIIHAEGCLLERPNRPVAVVINSGSEERAVILDEKRTTQRILARAFPVNWHVAVAIPRVDAWAMVDPRIREAFEADERTRDANHFYQRSLLFAELTRDQPFDVDALRRESNEFRQLEEFIGRAARTVREKPPARLF